jgi:hypothetical protein
MSHRNNVNYIKSVKGEIKATECHVCKKNGESIHVYSGHNFMDLKGRIVCSIFLDKKKKRNTGFDYLEKLNKFVLNMNKKNEEKIKHEMTTSEPNKGFDVLADDSSDDEFEKFYPYVTFRSKLALEVPKSWTEWSDTDDE